MSEKITYSPDGGVQGRPLPPALQEFRDKFDGFSQQIDSIEDMKGRATNERDTNSKLAPGIFQRYGGEGVYQDRINGYDEQITSIQNERTELNALYEKLGGDKIDELEKALQDQTGGRPRGTWSAEAIITERALQRAQEDFSKNYNTYKDRKDEQDPAKQAMALLQEYQESLKDPNISEEDRKKVLAYIRQIIDTIDGKGKGPGTGIAPESGSEGSSVADLKNALHEAQSRQARLQAEYDAMDEKDSLAARHKKEEIDKLENSINGLIARIANSNKDDLSMGSGPEEAIDRNDPELEGDDKDQIESRLSQYLQENHAAEVEQYMTTRLNFLEIMAKSQKGHLRRIKPDGWLASSLRLFPLGNKLADYLTKPTAKEAAAGAAYEEALDKLDELIHDSFLQQEVEKGNMSPEDARAHAIALFTEEDRRNHEIIAEIQQKNGGKPMSKWVRRAIYGGAAFVGGALAALSPMLSPAIIAAAAAAAAGARVHANKRNANLKNKGGTGYVVDDVAAGYHTKYLSNIQSRMEIEAEDGNNNWSPKAGNIVRSVYDATANEVGKNRNRVILPALGALAVAGLMRYLPDLIGGTTTTTTSNIKGPSKGLVSNIPPSGTVNTPPVAPDIQGLDFNVEPGNGYTHELRDFAEANGQELSGDQAYRLHLSLMEKFGPDYIDINGDGNDIYTTAAGDVRLMEPGSAKWSDSVAGAVRDWMVDQGIWK